MFKIIKNFILFSLSLKNEGFEKEYKVKIPKTIDINIEKYITGSELMIFLII